MAKEMLFSVVCPTCEAKIGVHDQRLINQLVQCPKCGSIVQLTPPEGYGKSVGSPQKTEVKPEKIAPPPAAPIPQPLPDKREVNEKPKPNSPPPAPKTPPVPVPPPAAIPVPPLVSIPEPIAPNTLMPEPMAPSGLNSNSASGGKSISQRVGALSEKLPSWTPYLIIGIGVIALIAMLVFFFLSGSRKEGNNSNQPSVENKENSQNKENEENVIADPLQNIRDGEDKKENLSDENTIDNKNNEVEANSATPSNAEDANKGENLMAENEKIGEPAPSEDSLDNVDEGIVNNEPVENVEINDEENEESQPEKKTDADNPFQEVEQNEETPEPVQIEPDADNPVGNEENALVGENDVTPDDISNNVINTDDNPTENSQSDSELSSIPGLNVRLKSISIRELKFSQCLQTLRELGALPVEVNWDSLSRNGVNADDKISWSGKDVTVQTALSEVLAQRGLMFKINDEEKIVFVPRVSVNARSGSSVNSDEQGGSAMVKAQYSVSDLVGQSPEQTAALIKSIREFLCPGDWKEVGGTGTISASGGGSIMITQSQHNQWIIADFLDRLRLARHLAPLYNRDASLEPMSVRAQSALKRNVGINFQPTADLKTALSEIGQRISVNILLDEPALKIAGISAQFPISFDARELSLEETFNRIKEETGLTYLAQTPNSFIVTTTEGAKSMMSVEFYPISDLVNIGLTPAVLMEPIVKFEPKSWKSQDAASFGLIDYDANSDCLIVRQSPFVLSKITELLTQIRARLKQKE